VFSVVRPEVSKGMEAGMEYCQQLGVSVATATRDLGKLVEVGQATRSGQGRSTRYPAT